MAWTKNGPSPKACIMYANVLRKAARTKGMPLSEKERRLFNEVGAIFDRVRNDLESAEALVRNQQQ